MKTKKPRFGKAVKPAARTVRRVTRSKPKTLRRKPSPAKAKSATRKSPQQPKRAVKRKTGAAIRTKVVRKRVIRKPKAEASPMPIESAQAEQTLLDSITKKPNRAVKRKTKVAVKTKTVRKWVIRKPRAKASPIPIESAQAEQAPLDRSEEHTSELQSLRHLVC